MKLINAHLIDGVGTDVIEGATIIFDGHIREIGADGRSIDYPDSATMDLEGRTVIPGLINAHVHLILDSDAADSFEAIAGEPVAVTAVRAATRARRMLEAGVTTARDVGGKEYLELAIRDMIRSGEVPGPRLLCSGKVITMTGGQGWVIGRECDGADDVRKGVREQLKAGVDLIKLMATGGILTPGVEPGSAQLSEEELRAGIIEAHKAGRRTATHAQGLEGIKAAIRAGIDTVEHGIFLDDEAVDMMKDNNVVFVPTLAAPYQLMQAGAKGGVPQFVLDKTHGVIDRHKQSFEKAWKAGVIIAAGNDGGTPFNPHEDLATEIRLMIEAGMPVLEAIRAGTWGSAKALGLEHEIGTVEPGKRADLVVLDENPLVNSNALSSVWCVIQGGEVVCRMK